jgi:hypothetical protein
MGDLLPLSKRKVSERAAARGRIATKSGKIGSQSSFTITVSQKVAESRESSGASIKTSRLDMKCNYPFLPKSRHKFPDSNRNGSRAGGARK